MTPLKFRAWHPKHKWAHNLLLDHIGVVTVFYDKGLKSDSSAVGLSKWTIEQSTGLKDKAGREIYEGDIIRFMGKWDKNGKVVDPDYLPYEIIWFMGGFVAFLISRDNASSVHRHNDVLGVGHTDSEVIGNIFETPELLK